MNLTPKRTNFQPLENSSGAVGVNVTLLDYFLAFALFPFLVLLMMSLFCSNLVNLFVVVVFTLQRMTSILPGTLPQLGPDRHHGQVN